MIISLTFFTLSAAIVLVLLILIAFVVVVIIICTQTALNDTDDIAEMVHLDASAVDARQADDDGTIFVIQLEFALDRRPEDLRTYVQEDG